MPGRADIRTERQQRWGRPETEAAADRAWFAALARLLSRRRWAEIFPVTSSPAPVRRRDQQGSPNRIQAVHERAHRGTVSPSAFPNEAELDIRSLTIIWVDTQKCAEIAGETRSGLVEEVSQDRTVAASAYGRSVPVSNATVNTTNSTTGSVIAENIFARLEPSCGYGRPTPAPPSRPGSRPETA
jgi:hypothetical protein